MTVEQEIRQLGVAPDPAAMQARMDAMHRVYEAFNTGDTGLLDAEVAEDIVEHEEIPRMAPGREGLRQLIGLVRAAFPDFTVTVEDLAAAGDRVFARLTLRGTHLGEWLGIPATGRTVEVQGVDVVRFEGGVGVEHWGVTDQLGMLQQLGVLPPSAGAEVDRRASMDITAVPVSETPEERNRAVVRRFAELLNRHEAGSALGEVWTEDLVWHGGSAGEIRGLDGLRALLVGFYEAFPDLHTELDDLIAEGDRVVARMTARGTHRGTFQGIPATGRSVTISGNNVYRLAGGKIVEEWWGEDVLGLMQQIGAIPAPLPPA